MWARNSLFIGLILGGVGTLYGSLFPARTLPRDQPSEPAALQPPGSQAIVDQVNATFRQQWAERKLTPTERASDLAIARRLALALMGTIPSLQEIRQLEARPGELGLQEWLERILRERRHADYFA